MERQLLRIGEVAEALGLSKATTYRLIARGALRAVRVGSRLRVPAAEIDRVAREGAPARPEEPAP
jgi:excisionase family DNA binding protein